MKRYKFPSKDKNFFINYNYGPYPETHCHEHWEFTIITKGNLLHKIGEYERPISENTLLVIRPDDVHSLNKLSTQDVYYVNIGVRDETLKSVLGTLSNGLYDFLLKGPYVEYEISKSTSTYFINMFNKFHTTIHDKQASDGFLSTIFISVIRELLLCNNKSKQTHNYSPAVNEFIDHMRRTENLTLSINDIIKKMNYSHCHIILLFKK